jgi:hypothetical protein
MPTMHQRAFTAEARKINPARAGSATLWPPPKFRRQAARDYCRPVRSWEPGYAFCKSEQNCTVFRHSFRLCSPKAVLVVRTVASSLNRHVVVGWPAECWGPFREGG